jgi:phage terminase small subunit
LNDERPHGSRPPDRLTSKEQVFVKAMQTGVSATEAAKIAYNPTNEHSAQSLAWKVMSRERVKTAIQKSLEDRFPDAATKIADIFKEAFDLSNNIRMDTRLKAIETFAKLMDQVPASKKASVNVSLKDKFSKLPGTE